MKPSRSMRSRKHLRNGQETRAPSFPFVVDFISLSPHFQGALVAFRPETGRKHQIRIHSARALSAPILGDTKYGPGVPEGYRDFLGRDEIPMHLHLHKILLKNWKGKGKDLTVTCPPPAYMRDTVFKVTGKKI